MCTMIASRTSSSFSRSNASMMATCCFKSSERVADDRVTAYTVSYTHLDVYKRQVLHTSCAEPFAPDIPFDGARLTLGPRSVAVVAAERR